MFAGHEIARHKITRQEIAGHEYGGPKMTAVRKNIAMSGRLKCSHLQVELPYFINDETQRSSLVESSLKHMPLVS